MFVYIIIFQSSDEYQMTATRGRGLIISNKYEYIDEHGIRKWRKWSELDFTNMKMMLEKFGFVVTGEHRNYTAKVLFQHIHNMFIIILLLCTCNFILFQKMVKILVTSHFHKNVRATRGLGPISQLPS